MRETAMLCEGGIFFIEIPRFRDYAHSFTSKRVETEFFPEHFPNRIKGKLSRGKESPVNISNPPQGFTRCHCFRSTASCILLAQLIDVSRNPHIGMAQPLADFLSPRHARPEINQDSNHNFPHLPVASALPDRQCMEAVVAFLTTYC